MEINNAKDVMEWFHNVPDELNWAFIVTGSILYSENWTGGQRIPLALTKNGVDKILHRYGLAQLKPRSLSGIKDYYFKCKELGQYIRDSHKGEEWVEGHAGFPHLIAFLNDFESMVAMRQEMKDEIIGYTGEQVELFKDTRVNFPEVNHPKSKSKSKKDKQQPEIIEFHDPLICERVKIQCERCSIIYCVIYRENNSYGFCSQCMGKKFTEIEGSRRTF